MLCALLQFGSSVSAVNKPSPPIARTRRSGPRTVLSKRFSSLSSSTRSWPETITSGAPIMSSQKIGPSSLASRARFCTGAVESSDSILPTTGLVGGWGIGASRLPVSIVKIASHPTTVIPVVMRSIEPGMTSSTKSLPPPFDQLGADFVRLFLLGPVPAAAHEILFEIGDDLLHTVGGRRWQHGVILRHDHQRRHVDSMVEPLRALPVARPVPIPVDAAGEAGLCKGIDEHFLFFRGQDRRAWIVLGIIRSDHLRKCLFVFLCCV